MELVLCAMEEIAIAWTGGDWGYACLAQLLGNEHLALSIVNLWG